MYMGYLVKDIPISLLYIFPGWLKSFDLFLFKMQKLAQQDHPAEESIFMKLKKFWY